ncbi:MAG: AbrB/MazE/SpoVT family DNA-binding domain-containing protein [Acidobacteria bacterium]|nr:AbrB/MazE/SpoVT family DNA-binding domain-containing protein [Acidobacteriota bacterium]
MKTTIDKAGRVVIPAAIRKRAGLKPGTELEVIMDDIAIHLVRTGPEPKLVRRGRRLIAKPMTKPENLPEVDLAVMVEEERNRWPW